MSTYSDIDTMQTLTKSSRIGRKLKAIAHIFLEARQESIDPNFYEGMYCFLHDIGQELLDLEEKPILKRHEEDSGDSEE